MKSFAILIGSVVLVYFLAPYTVHRLLPPGHSEQHARIATIAAMFITYTVVRRALRDRMPSI